LISVLEQSTLSHSGPTRCALQLQLLGSTTISMIHHKD
jgi:hypothetical protein